MLAGIAPIGGKIALIERGTCFFDDKLANAVAAGGVLVYTNLLPDGSENPKTIMGGNLKHADFRRDDRQRPHAIRDAVRRSM